MPCVAKSIITPEGNKFTPQQDAYIRLFVETGGGDKTQCAIQAGYAPEAAHTRAYELMQREDVLAEIELRTKKRLKSAVPLALECLVQMLSDPKTPATVRKDCAIAIMDRGGLRYAEKLEISMTLTPEQRRARIIELQKEMGLLKTLNEDKDLQEPQSQAIGHERDDNDALIIDVEPEQ